MSFGFGVGDFLAVAQLAHEIRKDFSGAPSQFKNLSDETKLLSMVLQDVDVKVNESDLTPQQEANLEQAISTCEFVLHDLQAVCDKFSKLDNSQGHSHKSIRRIWKKLEWEPDEGRELRERISSSIAMLTTLLNQLSSETTVAVKKSLDRLNQGEDSQERLAILNWLSSFDHAAQQNDISAQRQADTGVWFLESPEFISWRSTRGETLYCSGIPGAGKTILSSIVVEELTKQFRDDSSVCITHIYLNYQQHESQTINQVFSNLLRQLGEGQPDIPAAVQNLYKQHLKRGSKPKFDEISGLLQSLSSLYSTVFIIIDALNECPSRDGRQNILLSEIMKLQAAFSANLFCTSRPIPEIESWFPEALSIQVRASDNDVRKYLDGQIARLPGFVARSPELLEQVKTQIVQDVDGMFLLAHLHLESLIYKRTAKALRTALEGLPRGSTAYDDTYERTMRRIETQLPEQAGLAKDVLQWIVCACTPLSVSELQHALAVESGEEVLDLDNLPDAADMVTACGGLVTVDQASGIIRLVHCTTQEYFERTRETWFPTAEEQMAEVCLSYLSLEPFTRKQCETWDEYDKRLDDWPFYRYACEYWGFHACRTSPARIMSFIQMKQAFWSSLQPLFDLLDDTEDHYSDRPLDPVEDQVTALHIAALFGFVDVVRELADPETVDKQTYQGLTPLAFAAEQGHDEIIRLLLIEYGANANLDDEWGTSPLFRAVHGNHTSSVKLLLEVGKANMMSTDLDGKTPLFLAVLEDQVEMVACFVNTLGTSRDRYRDSQVQLGLILRTAAAHGSVGIVKLLISLPHVRPNVSGATMFRDVDDEPGPPLVWAARRNQSEVCKILVETGRVRDNITDRTDRTALSYAVENNSTEIIDMLLRIRLAHANPTALAAVDLARANQGDEDIMKFFMAVYRVTFEFRFPLDINAGDQYGMNPLSYAVVGGHEEAVEALLRTPGIDVKCTPLALAAFKGHPRIVQRLLDTGHVKPDLKAHIHAIWQTPLAWAIEGYSEIVPNNGGHEAVVELLLRTRQVNVNSKSLRGGPRIWHRTIEDETPLLIAIRKRAPPTMVKLLLENGADPNVTSHDGSTPLSNAIKNGCRALVDMLLEYGAQPLE